MLLERKWRSLVMFGGLVILLFLLLPLQKPDHHIRQFMNLQGDDAWEARIENTAKWIPLAPFKEHWDGKPFTGYFWLKRTIPEHDLRDPHLYIRNQKSFEVYLGEKKLYQYNMVPPDEKVNPLFQWHLVPLEKTDQGKTLRIRLYSHGTIAKGGYLLGNASDFLQEFILKDSVKLILSLLFFSSGFISIVVYGKHPKDLSYLFFSLFAWSVGWGCIQRTMSLQLFWDVPLLSYLHELSLPLATFAFFAFFDWLDERRTTKTRRQIWLGMCCFLAVSVVIAFFHEPLYRKWVEFVFPLATLAVFILSFAMIIRAYRHRRDKEMGWMLTGYFFVVLFSFSHILFTFIPSLQPLFFAYFPNLYYYYLGDDPVFIGLFLFLICLGVILLHRFGEVHRKAVEYADELKEKNHQLQQYHQTLEHRVAERTAELEKVNRQLKRSMQETLQSLAEVAVLEERNRISKEIHDIVGHTLTVTIVQMEAAKRLIEKDKEQTKARLERSQELVRKGLDDIRGVVHLLKEDRMDFISSLHRLLEETETDTGVRIHSHISPLPPLSKSKEKALYFALQEGLTNGIRHGESNVFIFTLEHQDSLIHFELRNNGKKFESSHLGFGLSAMKERIEQLEGTMEISNLDPHGCRLVLVLPVQ